MITEKLYQKDVYLKVADALVTGLIIIDEKQLITLDRTIFFPTGGGQSADRGTISEIPVLDVYEKGGEIYHQLDSNSVSFKESNLQVGEKVSLKIDWNHRFDNMQRHCGEHILSGIFYREFGGINRGFHMGDDYMTIDISLGESSDYHQLTWDMVKTAEIHSNQIIWQNLPMVTSHFDTYEEANKFPMRKSLSIESDITLVGIGSYDNGWGCVACCGTHPSHTGQVGLIKAFKLENNKGMFRIYFEAGKRAFLKYQEELDTLLSLSNRLSAGTHDLLSKYNAQQEKNKEKGHQLFQIKKELVKREIQGILANPQRDHNGYPVHKYNLLSLEDVTAIGNGISPNLDGLVFLIHEPSNTLFLVSNGQINCGELIKDNVRIYGGKGGGNKTLARGIFPKSEYIETFIDLIEKHLK